MKVQSQKLKVKKLIDEHTAKIASKIKSGHLGDRSKITSEYLQGVSHLTDVENEINQELSNIVSEPCRMDATLWILAAQLHSSELYFESISKLLENADECIWHEGIIEIFQILKDARAIPVLEKALKYDLAYDPEKAVAVRILETLADIGTLEAVNILKDCLNSPSAKIRKESRIMLDSISDI